MNDSATRYRNSMLHAGYTRVLKPIFFRNDPERVHDHMIRVGSMLGKFGFGRGMTRALFSYAHPSLEQDVLGIHFANPLGLSAGFDKNAELVGILPSVGFGFAELGSITGEPCAGNPKPRLWRLKNSRGLVVYYGLKNDGCEAISARLRGVHSDIPLGMSVAMTNCAANTDLNLAIADYAKAFKTMESCGEYITVNISCPNTTGGQPFMNPDNLDKLFQKLDTIPTIRPVFVKLSPDVGTATIDAIYDVLARHRVQGIICTNLTKKRDNPHILDASVPEVGGMSGKVVEDAADELLAYVYRKDQKAGGRFVLVGSGGVFTAADAYRKIRLGASLVQLITGMVFEGPQVVSEINRGLVELLARDGFAHVSEAVGTGNR